MKKPGVKSAGGELKRLTLRVPHETADALKHRAIDARTTMQDIIEQLINDYLRQKAARA